jgi:hypothetical protein
MSINCTYYIQYNSQTKLAAGTLDENVRGRYKNKK